MINKASLIRSINKAVDIPLREASSCVDIIIDEISNGIFGDVRSGQWGED